MKKLFAILSVVLFANQASAMEIRTFEKVMTEAEQEFYIAGFIEGIMNEQFEDKLNEKLKPPWSNPVCFPDGLQIGGDIIMYEEWNKLEAIAHSVKIAREALELETDKTNEVTVAIRSGLYKLYPCK